MVRRPALCDFDGVVPVTTEIILSRKTQRPSSLPDRGADLACGPPVATTVRPVPPVNAESPPNLEGAGCSRG